MIKDDPWAGPFGLRRDKSSFLFSSVSASSTTI